MTMPAPATVKTIDLPAPRFPMVARMISNALFPANPPTKEVLDQRARRLLAALSQPAAAHVELISAALSEAHQRSAEEVVTWAVAHAHPIVPDSTVVRMFIAQGGVEVYSVSSDRATGTRNFIPLSSIRLIEEVMPLEEFISELADAESEDDEDEDDEPEPEPDLTPAPTPNGQPVTS